MTQATKIGPDLRLRKKMNMVLIVVLGTIFAASVTSGAEGSEANVLLKVTENKTYELVKDALEELSKIDRPARVFAAVGNARIGKSTMLNLMTNMLDERNRSDSVEGIFETGDSFEQVTRNVWMHIIPQPRGENGSVVLLDVEGFNLGEDAVTKHLSMFTAMMSSCLILFVDNYLGNNDINFLYEISRLSDLVFPNKTDLTNFPKLHIVVRSNLKSPKEIESYVRGKLFRSDKNGNTQSKASIIERYFARNNIAVSQIPIVSDPKILHDLSKLRKSSHWSSFDKLVSRLMEYHEKRIIEGSPVDGQALVKLAEEVVKAMNEGSWENFGDVYLTLEKFICRRSYEKYIKPVLLEDWRVIEDMMMEKMDDLRKECFLKSELEGAMKELKNTLNGKRSLEEETKRQGERSWFTHDNSKCVASGYAAGLVTCYFLSDENLKSNLTVLPSSPYNDIGLTGVCWKWNDIAKQKYGLTGEACGVIAQQVQKLYPKAVLVGEDGFVQVRYGILHTMINHVRDKRC